MGSSVVGETNHVPLKYESPYDATSAVPQETPLKRRRSEEDAGYKRQRIETGSGTTGHGDALSAILAQTGPPAIANSVQPLHYNQGQIDSFNQYGATAQPSGFWDPHRTMRINSLEILNNLSTQILATLAQGPWAETIRIITEPEKELGQAYSTLKSLFDQTKKIYTQQEPFLSADELSLIEDSQHSIIRTTNLATFVSGVFAGDVGFYELNDHFIETFTPSDKSLSKEHGELFLNLKTQVYLSALSQEEQERTQEEILYEMFPEDIESILFNRHQGTPLSEAEKGFVEELKTRREYLMGEASDVESIQKLSNMFAWEDFLRSLSDHLREAYGPMIAPYMKRHAPPPDRLLVDSHQAIIPNGTPAHDPIADDFALEAEREVQKALQMFMNQSQSNSDNHAQQNGEPLSNHNTFDRTFDATFETQYTATDYFGTTIPVPPSQSAPTQVLYEKARQAAVAKSNPGNARRPGLPSARRPWSQEEENALMAGLDLVKGPHWSQILNLYGPEGTVNNVLRERNQVQLKDKARNLKLFFLKSNTEVPHYLRTVTGELKTRAPSQAARKEAEELARLNSSEEQMKVNGIMALSSIRDNPYSIEHYSDGYGSQSPVSDVTLSSHRDDAPEVFNVVEPEPENSHQPDADERLREQLSAHNNGF